MQYDIFVLNYGSLRFRLHCLMVFVDNFNLAIDAVYSICEFQIGLLKCSCLVYHIFTVHVCFSTSSGHVSYFSSFSFYEG